MVESCGGKVDFFFLAQRYPRINAGDWKSLSDHVKWCVCRRQTAKGTKLAYIDVGYV